MPRLEEHHPTASRAERLAANLLIVGAFAVVVVATPYRLFELDRFFLPKEVVLHATAAIVALLVLPGRREWSWSRVDLLLVGYLALSLLSAAFARNGWWALRALGVTWSGLLIYWSARELARAGLGRRIALGLAAGAVVGVLSALGQAYGLLDTELLSLSRAPGGLLGNRNFVAHLGAIVLPTVVAAALGARTRRGYPLAVLSILLIVLLLVLTRSRAAWLATLASGTVAGVLGFLPGGLWRDESVRRRVQGPLLAVVLGAVLALILPNALDWRSDSPYADTLRGLANYQEGSGRGRLVQWRNSLLLVQDDPLLGVGPGNWAVAYPAVAPPNDPSLSSDGTAANPWPSSDWVAALSERGIPAFLLLLAAGVLLLSTAARTWLAGPRTVDDLPALTLLATVAAVAVVGAFDAVLLLPIPALYTWALVGALAPVESFPTRRPATGSAKTAAVLVVLTAGWLLTWRSVQQVRAMSVISVWGRMDTRIEAARLDPGSYRIQLLVASSLRRRGRCREAVEFARRAAELLPEAAEPPAQLRACGVR